ncbi:hypothetical protein ACFLZ4_00700 [Patescibacteria group bacterium]
MKFPFGPIYDYRNKYNDLGEVFIMSKNFNSPKDINKKVEVTVKTSGKRDYYDDSCTVNIITDPENEDLFKVENFRQIESCKAGHGLKIAKKIEAALNREITRQRRENKCT